MGSPFTDVYRYLAYGTSAVVGCGACSFLVSERFSPFLASFLGDCAATASIFAFSVAANNSCVYDAYWPVAPIPIAAYWLSLNPKPSTAAITGFGLLAAWALRYLCLEVRYCCCCCL
jgi:steroid 5-alpha reductase family enzyme